MPIRPGEQLGDYQILRLLGAGGMGEVYQVRNVLSDRVEAIKVLPSALQANQDLQDRFLREIKISASLRHPHIAELRTAQRVDGLLVMVMEFVDGVSLDYLLRNGPLPLKNALHYTNQVLDALDFAHARGVVHRDIKPQNVMVTPGDEVRLMDFGIARSLGEETLTMTGMTLGSLYYMSPEQIRGEEVDGRADLYSLGVVLYEMVTGSRPFKGSSGYTVMAAHLEQQPPPPLERVPGLPEPLSSVILKALKKKPEERFQNAAAFREAIRELDQLVSGPVDGLILTRAFEAKAAEAPLETPKVSPESTPTQTLPTTPRPGGPPPSSQSGAPQPTMNRSSMVAVLAVIVALVTSVVALAAIFGPRLIDAVQGPREARQAPAREADQAVSEPASRPEQMDSGEVVTSRESVERGMPPPPPGAAPPPQRPELGMSAAPNRQGSSPDGGGPRVREVDEEVRQAMDAAAAELKAAGIDMQLFGPSARDGRRFAALERAQDFAEVARRYGALAKRKTEAEKQRREMFRLMQEGQANRRVRQRVMTEMSENWRAVTEASAAAEAAIKSQNLALAEENLGKAETALNAIDKMIAAARERSQQRQN